jgi:phage-related protein
MSTQHKILPFGTGVNYAKFDVFRNIFNSGAGGNWTSPLFVATQASQNQFPSGLFVYPITSYNRVDDLTILNFAKTGVVPNIVAGSQISVTGINTDITINYTGMVIDGGSGWCKFINPGWATGINPVTVGAITCYNPAFTTGFMFIPTYSTKMPITNSVISAKFGDGYEQRTSAGLNTFAQGYQMVFQSRSAREMRAIVEYVQDKAGVYPFQILVPDQFLNNQPNQKYVAAQLDVNPVAYGLYDINVTVVRVFDL